MGYARELLAVALAEMRSARRLTRTWLFSALSLIIGLGLYTLYTAMHGLGSALSPSVGVFNPRFMMAGQGVLIVVVFVVAVIFLAFDIRARDTRERIAEVLDVRPVGNLTLLVGRLAGLVFIAWLVVALLALSWQGLGALAQALDWPAGDLVEPRSLLALLFLDAPPALVMWCSVVILLAVTVRNRIAVAVLALGLVAGWVWGATQLPLYLQPAIAGQAAGAIFPSDIVPFSVPAFQLAQRACMLALGAGFLFLAAALHPRADHRRHQRFTIGAALVVLAGAGILVLLWKLNDDRAQQAHWLAVHQARQDDPRPGLESVAGTVVIAPGDQLALALDYVVAPPGGQPLLFSLNPGMRLTALRVEGNAADFSHRDGLLEIDLPPALADRSTLTISLAASGVPQPAFGYLDSAKDLAPPPPPPPHTARQRRRAGLPRQPGVCFRRALCRAHAWGVLDALAGRGGRPRRPGPTRARLLWHRHRRGGAKRLVGGRARSPRRRGWSLSFPPGSARSRARAVGGEVRAQRHASGPASNWSS